MRKGYWVVGVGIFCALALTAWSQQTASTASQLQKLVINESEVKAALGPDWRFQVKLDLNDKPPNSITAALIYGNTQTSMMAALFQFNEESQAHDFFAAPLTDADKILARENQDTLNEAFKVSQNQGAAEVELVKIRLGVVEALSADEQQLVLRFRVGRTVAKLAIRLCIPEHFDAASSTLVPYVCFDEARLKEGLIKAGQKQLEVLFSGR